MLRIRVGNSAMTRIQRLLVIAVLVASMCGAYFYTYYYSPTPQKKRFVIDFWYESSGHHSQSEDQAMLYKTQLERTGLITVNLNYWGAAEGYPKIKHIIIRFYSDATALAVAMKAGDIDIAERQLAAVDIKHFQTDPTVRVWQGTGAYVQYICFQEKIAPFDNPKVRQAIAAALDRQELVDTVFLGQAVPL